MLARRGGGLVFSVCAGGEGDGVKKIADKLPILVTHSYAVFLIIVTDVAVIREILEEERGRR